MKKAKIEKILSAKTRKAAGYCAKIAPQFESEDIHKFRVEVKCLRSFLRLLNMEMCTSQFKLPKKFKALYDIAGEIRQAQLETDTLKKRELPFPTYQQHLQNIISDKRKEWKKRYSKTIIKGFEDEFTSALPAKLQYDTLTGFFGTCLKEINSILMVEPDNDQIHSYRKRIKDMLYLAKIAEEYWAGGYKTLSKFPLKLLDHLSDIIGSYNDERIMLDKLLRFSSHSMPAKENELLYKYCKAALKEQEANKQKVVVAIKHFLQQTQASV